MRNTFNFQLIDGNYSLEDTKEILQDLIKSKINFHNIKNFTSEIRFNSASKDSRERIDYLKNVQKKLTDFLENNEFQGSHFDIQAEVRITFLE